MKIGVFICYCGSNIAATVDVEEVAEYARRLEGVVVARTNKYTCSDPGQETIRQDIVELGLDRVVVGACSPRMHERTFRAALQKAGLNPYFLEVANIREHCSWVHSDIPLATVQKDKITHLTQNYHRRRSDRHVDIYPYFEERVTMVYYYPNMHPDIIDSLVEKGYKGIIIAGTGLGHVNKPLYPAIERAAQAGVAIYMTVQTLWGYVHMFVYETGSLLNGPSSSCH